MCTYDGSASKESTCNAGHIGDRDSVSELGRSPGGGNGNPLQYSGLENPMVRGAWWSTVPRVTKSWTQLKQLSIRKSEMKVLPKISDLSVIFI